MWTSQIQISVFLRAAGSGGEEETRDLGIGEFQSRDGEDHFATGEEEVLRDLQRHVHRVGWDVFKFRHFQASVTLDHQSNKQVVEKGAETPFRLTSVCTDKLS